MAPANKQCPLIVLIIAMCPFVAEFIGYILFLHYDLKLNTLAQLDQCLAADTELIHGMRKAEDEQQSRLKGHTEKNLSLEGVDQEPIMTITQCSVGR